MKSIHAIWKDGRIVPTRPVDTALIVDPIDESQAAESAGDLLGDDPASIAHWLAWYDSLEPLIFTPEEEAVWRRRC
jgi:hypothetical protein